MHSLHRCFTSLFKLFGGLCTLFHFIWDCVLYGWSTFFLQKLLFGLLIGDFSFRSIWQWFILISFRMWRFSRCTFIVKISFFSIKHFIIVLEIYKFLMFSDYRSFEIIIIQCWTHIDLDFFFLQENRRSFDYMKRRRILFSFPGR